MLPLMLFAAAYAVTCEEILNMVRVSVPTPIVVQTIEKSGEVFSEAELRCLTQGQAPGEVIDAVAKKLAAAGPPGSNLTMAETPEAEPPPEEGSPRSARQRVLELLSSPLNDPKDHYFLGLALQQMGLLHLAQSSFIEVIKAGPADPYFAWALTKLVEVAGVTGDHSDLARIASKIPPESFPRSVGGELFYQVGLRLYDQGKLAEASRQFDNVSDSSGRIWHARYLYGVIRAEGCTGKRAIRAFTEVAIGSPDRELRDVARLEIGNIYFSLERFDDAVVWFTLPPDSPRYTDGLLRLAWTQYRLDQPVSALDHVPHDAWLPEAGYLGALVATQGDYAAALAQIDTFEATYAPIEAQLRTILARHVDPEAAEVAFRLYGDPRTSSLPAPLLAQVYRDRELQGFVAHLAMLDHEERVVRRQPRPWREAVGDPLVAVLVEDRSRLQRRAGRVLLARLTQQAASLAGLLADARLLRFELVDAHELDAHARGRPTPDTSTGLLRALIPELQEDLRREATLRLAVRVEDAEAIPLLESLLDPRWPRADDALYQLALADSSRRIELLTKLVTAWPTSEYAPDAWLMLGDDHFAHSRFAEARDAYLQVASLSAHPHYAYANYRLGWALHALGDHAGGQEKLGVAIGAAKDKALRAYARSEREKLSKLR